MSAWCRGYGDKFKKTSLTVEKSNLFNAPIVKEFPYAFECLLVKRADFALHAMFVGEIVGMVSESEVLNPNIPPDIEKVRPRALYVQIYKNRVHLLGELENWLKARVKHISVLITMTVK